MNRLARTGLTALSLAAVLGLSACASVNEPVSVGPARYAAPAQIGSPPPVLASLPPPSLSIAEEPAPSPIDDMPSIVRAAKRLNCVEYARDLSGIRLAGDAKNWWESARGKFFRQKTPASGAVMVFAGAGKMKRGHLAVVKRVVSSREIRIDHANWMSDGRVYLNAAVVDISPDNDWSVVKVWNTRDGKMGTRRYPIRGFISPAQTTASAD
jgi:surface antigen